MSRFDANVKANGPPTDGDIGPQSGGPDEEPKEIRMIGDFDGNANALWTLYGKEAKSYDEARIETLKDDMDGLLVFVRSCFIHQHDPYQADPHPHRLVYFLLRSLPSSSTASRT
jgi:hypothetical protein